ncbi:MAG: glycoside hydrolase family 9 protein, partial [Anaerolineales bacterium]|nr:glycoside hydrolase family 9 protein [Anaerolineales bacterium]
MKHKWIIVLLIASIFISSCGGSPTESANKYETIPPAIPGEVVYIPFPVNITVDGDLSDWAGLPSQTVDTGSMLSPDPEENGSFSFSVASDADNFYITMQMADKNIVAGQHGTDFWNEDSMEFYINASDNLNAGEYGLKIFQVNINAADIGNTAPTALTITGVFSSDAKATGFVFKTETGWGFEASVPLQDLLTVEHGKEIGFQSQINGATTLDRDVKLIWSKYDTADTSWQNPSLFGRGIFFELGRTDIPQASARVEVQPTAIPEKEAFMIPNVISLNQIGYFVNAKKIASLVSDSTSELDWQLQNNNGEIILSGKTIVKGFDAASGDSIHFIDFSAFNTVGDGYKLVANDLESPSFIISDEIYSQLKFDAMAYYYHNRSGIPIEAKFVGDDWSRAAGHVTDNNVTCFKGKDADGKTWLDCPYTLDVAGGWYDAGDFGKYVVNGGISAWTLQNLYERFPNVYADGSLNIPENNNGVSDLLDESRWEMEFLLSMQIPQGQDGAGLAHHKIHDRKWEPIPVLPPTEMNNNNDHAIEGEGRYLFPPSTAATLNLAASAAQCAR